MNFKKRLKILDDLSLPKDEFVIVGSGTLAALNIRDAEDIDIIVSDKIWIGLSKKFLIKKKEWKNSSFEYIDLDNDIEVLGTGSIFNNSSIIPVESIFKESESIDGFRYINLRHLKAIKEALGRKVDLDDIDLIDKYLS